MSSAFFPHNISDVRGNISRICAPKISDLILVSPFKADDCLEPRTFCFPSCCCNALFPSSTANDMVSNSNSGYVKARVLNSKLTVAEPPRWGEATLALNGIYRKRFGVKMPGFPQREDDISTCDGDYNSADVHTVK